MYIVCRKLEEKRQKCKEAIETTDLLKKENIRIKTQVNWYSYNMFIRLFCIILYSCTKLYCIVLLTFYSVNVMINNMYFFIHYVAINRVTFHTPTTLGHSPYNVRGKWSVNSLLETFLNQI